MRAREKALEALLRASTLREAAELSGVSLRTIHRLLNDVSFSEQLKAAQRERLSCITRSLESLASEALEALASVLREPDKAGANTKRLAAVSVIDLMLKVGAHYEIEERLSALEQAIKK